MKILLKYFIVMCCLCGWSSRAYGQGYIVPNGIGYGGGDPILGAQFTVRQDPNGINGTAFFLRQVDINSFSFITYADEGVRVFLLSPEDPASLPAIQSHRYTELGGAPSYVFEEGVDYFVGLYTGNGYPQNGVYPNPMYGWAQLVNEGGTIKLLDSALAYGADGIYAGTRTLITIPEPGTLALAALGGLFLGLRRRRNSSPPPV